jgi:uncharacterized protein
LIELIRQSQYVEQPWKNGGGLTREIAVEFSGGSQSQMLWRVSVATIVRDGPFSEFRGYDRTIVAIDGGPVELHVDEELVTLLHAQPFEFAGESKVTCHLGGGIARDLNVMTSRNSYAHDVEIVTVPQRFVLDEEEICFVYAIEGAAWVDETACEQYETLRVDGLNAIGVRTQSCAAVVRITPL